MLLKRKLTLVRKLFKMNINKQKMILANKNNTLLLKSKILQIVYRKDRLKCFKNKKEELIKIVKK